MTSVALISPAYFCSEKEKNEVKKNLKEIGFKEIKDFTNKNSFFGKWAGSPYERLKNFYLAWNSDSEVIMCCRGGSGVSHFLSLINKNRLKKKKLLVGYSDITFLLNFIQKELMVLTFHGPNGLKKLDKISVSSLRDALQMKNYGIKFDKKQCYNVSKFKVAGFKISGKTIGGNLERLVENLMYLKLDFNNKIVFLEENLLTEHKIFNLLVSLKNYPSFRPKAIVFGNMSIKNKELMKKMILSLFPGTPLIFDISFGHTTPNITIPFGVECKIDFEKNKLDFVFSKKDKKYAAQINEK